MTMRKCIGYGYIHSPRSPHFPRSFHSIIPTLAIPAPLSQTLLLPLQRQRRHSNISNINTSRTYSSQKLPSDIVHQYWEDLVKASKDPTNYSLNRNHHTSNSNNNNNMKSSLSTTQQDSLARKLVSDAVKTKRSQGDLMPSLVTRQCCEFYNGLDLEGKKRFLTLLSKDFGVKPEDIATAAKSYIDMDNNNNTTTNSRSWLRATKNLRTSLTPLHETFFAQVNELTGGLKFLINMRADLLKIISNNKSHDPYLSSLDESLKSQLQTYFSQAFLELERISWNSPASVLEKIVKYEAVHAIPSWDHLKMRVSGRNRLCFGFFHRGVPLEPLVFVQVALTGKMSDNIHSILEHKDDGLMETKGKPTHAIFYSITSPHRGLAAIDLGNFLIKRVVKEIQQALPDIETFATLSPIPGFRKWIDLEISMNGWGIVDSLVNKDLIKKLGVEKGQEVEWWNQVIKSCEWIKYEDKDKQALIKDLLYPLVRHYLIFEKRRGLALDPVANFHLRNGACLHRINFLGNTSEKGMLESYGFMVNYHYVLDQVEENNAKYLIDGRVVSKL